MKNRSHVVLCVTSFMLLAITSVAPASARGGGDIGRSATISGVTIYLGVASAAMIREQYATQSPEDTMHGGVPAGRSEHHVMVALFDAGSGKRITNAQAIATVRQVGFYGRTKPLLPMAIAGDVTYGNYFRMPDNTPYRIEVSIQRPGVSGKVHAAFRYEDVTR